MSINPVHHELPIARPIGDPLINNGCLPRGSLLGKPLNDMHNLEKRIGADVARRIDTENGVFDPTRAIRPNSDDDLQNREVHRKAQHIAQRMILVADWLDEVTGADST